ncbi:MAG: inverse autotransporter beta domain-containing protein, partial [Pseudomonadota bacterium]
MRAGLFGLIAGVLAGVTAATGALAEPSGSVGELPGLAKDIARTVVGRNRGALPTTVQRVRTDWTLDNKGFAGGKLSLAQPLKVDEQKGQALFHEVNLTYENRQKTTVNAGLGLTRQLADHRINATVTVFHDAELKEGHQRAGAGLAVTSTAFRVKTNAYRGLTGGRASTGDGQEKTVDAVDLTAEGQVPFVPAARFRWQYEAWESETAEETPYKSKFGVVLTPTSFLTLSGQYEDNAWADEAYRVKA